MADLKALSVAPGKLTEGVNEMFYSVPMNPKRAIFLKDFEEMDSVDFFKKWFPVNIKVRINSFVRLLCHRWGSIRLQNACSYYFIQKGTLEFVVKTNNY